MVYPSRWLRSVAILATGVLGMCMSVRAQNWSAAVDVSGNNGDNSATPQTAVDGAGNIYVVWEDDTDNGLEILLRKSTDKGATFPDPVVHVSPGSSSASAPRIAIDSKNVIYVVWEDAPTAGQQIFVNRSIDGGQSFLGPVALSDSRIDSGNPVLAVDAFDNVDVAWEVDFSPLPNIPVGIYFSHRMPDGTYSSPVNVASNPYGSFVPQMALGSDGSVNLIWEDDDPLGRQSVSFAHSSNPNNGGSFDPAITLSSGAGTDLEGQLAVDSLANVNAVWLGVDPVTRNADVYFSQWAVQVQGTHFTTPVNLSQAGGSTDNPRVASDANGNLYVVWQGSNGSSLDIFFSAFSASSGGSPNFSVDRKNLSGGLGNATFPWIAVDTNNAVTVAWQLSAPGMNNIFAARTSDGGVNFSTQNLLNDTTSSSQVELVTDSSGDTSAVWADAIGIDPISKAPIAQVFFSQFANPKSQNLPPVARVAAVPPAHATGPNGAMVTLDGSGSSDPDGDALTYAWTDENGNAVGTPTPTTQVTVPLGMHTFTLMVMDPAKQMSSASTVVTVNDQPPVARVGANQTVEATGPNGATVRLDGSGSSDPDRDALTYAWTDENGNAVGTAMAITYVTVPLGTHTFKLTVADPAGLTSCASTTVTVRDTTKPTLQVSVSPTNLWPANHKLVEITATVSASDTVDPNPAIKLVSITSDDPSTTLDDIQAVGGGPVAFGTDVTSFLLRADRDPKNSPRTYTVTYCAKDASGNTTKAFALVTVGPPTTAPTSGTLAGSRLGGKYWKKRRHDRD